MLTFTKGMKLLAAKHYDEVYARSVEALQANERTPLAFFFLGIITADHGQHSKALEFFAKASELEPENQTYQTYHARALANLGHFEEATKKADALTSAGIHDALLADMIGLVYSRGGHQEQAIPLFELATKKNPGRAEFYFNLAVTAQFIGDFEKAKTAYAKAVSLKPKFYQAWFALVSLARQNVKNNHLDTLKTLFEAARGDAEARLLLGHSIAKTLEDMGQYEDSFDWLEKAKEAKKAQILYNAQTDAKLFAAAKSTSAATPLSPPPAQQAPIFIIGLPRTGTTLLDRIVSSHKDVTSAGELELFSWLIKEATKTSSRAITDAQTLRAGHGADLAQVRARYLEKLHALGHGTPFITDKTPHNFFYAGLIHQALPEARILALRRGAMDSCLSNYRQLFATHKDAFNYTFALDSMAAYYHEFDALMVHWRAHLPQDRFMEMNYEDIIHDQENQTRRLLEFCGLDWDEACLQFQDNAAPVDTASSVQVRARLHAESIGRWKKYGDRLESLKAALGDLTGME
jgi:tetratricopeptide (TPR) repeat protein